MFLTILIALISLVALMVIHEFGHFIIAKKFGVKVEEFGIGYPPRIYGKQFGETFYSINAIPFGAFVKIHGETDEPGVHADKTGSMDDYRSFAYLPIWKRVLIVLGGVIAFWLAAVVIFSAVFLVGASLPVGDQDVIGIANTNIVVTGIEKDSPAQYAKLQPGDTILTIKNDKQLYTVNKIEDFQKYVQANKGKTLVFTVVRGSQTLYIPITPRKSYPENQGPTGVELERIANVIKKAPWYQAPFKGLVYTGNVTMEAIFGIVNVFASLFSGKGVPQGAELAGPVGITIYLARAAQYGPGFFLYFIGSICVLIALFNVFPIPALDGGKLLFLIIEAIRKKPISEKLEQRITIGFFVLLIAMSIFVTIKFDIPRVMEFWKAG